MTPTRRLYEETPTQRIFDAVVLDCRPDPSADGYRETALDATAFYPEGGGQPCDLGMLGDRPVLAVRIDSEGVVWHRTAEALTPGQTVHGEIDWARRFDHMQQHTGEHILSGILHSLYGAENVGFHIGSPAVRVDVSLPLTADQLAKAEELANDTVQADKPVRCWVPPRTELAGLPYRSKKELEGDVRLVDAGGADLCACCGTHVATTGQVGLIKILSAQNYKGGVRLAVACGKRAYQAVCALWKDSQTAGALLSVPAGESTRAVRHLLDAQSTDRQRLAALQNALADQTAAAAPAGQPCVGFFEGPDPDGLRRICLSVAQKTGARCAVFAPGGQGLAYALSDPEDARTLCRRLNARFGGRGGGKSGFCQGSLPAGADRKAVEAFLLQA